MGIILHGSGLTEQASRSHSTKGSYPMKKYLTYILTVLFATIAVSFAGPDKAVIEAKEKAAWQSFKDKDAAGFQKVVDKDIRCVYGNGIRKLQDELNDLKTSDIKSFT